MITTIALVLAYIGMWAITISLRERYISWNRFEAGTDRPAGHIFLGMFWFIYLPCWGLYSLALKASKADFKLPSPTRKKGEIAKGVPCPVFILVQLIKASLLKEATAVTNDGAYNDKVSYSFQLGSYNYGGMVKDKSLKYIRVGAKKLYGDNIPKESKEEIIRFHEDLLRIKTEQEALKIINDTRNNAVDAIEWLIETK